MRIAFVPIDNRPVCYNLAVNIASIDEEIEFLIPSRDLLGDLQKSADVNGIFLWLEKLEKIDALILSLDTITYGGLIPSRRCVETFEELKKRTERLKPVLENKKVYAFSSIMRISNNNYNEEEKEYWADWGKKIFEFSFSGGKINNGIPDEIIKDYLSTRKRNFEINKIYLEWQKEGLFDTLIFSKDDCAEKGFNVDEAKELARLGGKIKTGADEIPLALFARAVHKDIKIYPKFMEPQYKECISNYEDVSIEKSVLGQIELCGLTAVNSEAEADIILIVNNFKNRQGELVMGWDTEPFNGIFVPPEKPYCIADVRYANGADNSFINQLLQKIDLRLFYGYSGWNTSANSIGSLLAAAKTKWNAKKYNNKAFTKLQLIRFLDDWVYQANIRGQIHKPQNIDSLMKPYEERLKQVFNCSTDREIKYNFPWNRKFEIEVSL